MTLQLCPLPVSFPHTCLGRPGSCMEFDPVSLISQTQVASPSIQLNCNIDPTLAATSGARSPLVKSETSFASPNVAPKGGHYTSSPSQSPINSPKMIASNPSGRSRAREDKRARAKQQLRRPKSPAESWNDPEEEQQEGAEESFEVDYSQTAGMVNQDR